jgi:hypothetical protein
VVQCALAAAKKKGSYLQAQFYRIKARRGPNQFYRIKARRGPKKAIMAVVAFRDLPPRMARCIRISAPPFQAPLHRPAEKSPGQALVRARYAVELKPLAA